MENSCLNCKYFVKYYAILDMRLQFAGGKCMHEQIYNPRKRTNDVVVTDCKYWETDTKNSFEKRKQRAETLLYDYNDKLTQIIQILNLE